MRPFISLVKMSLNVYYGISAFKHRHLRQKKELWRPLTAIIGAGAGLSVFLGAYLTQTFAFYAAGKMLGQPWLVLELSILAGEILMFFFGLSWVISVLYFSNDLPLLLSFPLKSYQVLLSKFLLVLTNQYIFLLFVLLPPFLIYGAGENAGLLYYLTALTVFLCVPVIPLGAGTLLVMPLINWASKKRARDFFTVLFYSLMLVFVVAIQFFLRKNPSLKQPENMAGFLDPLAELSEQLAMIFPPVWWTTKAMVRAGAVEGLFSLFLLVSSSLVIFLLLILLGQKFFLKGIQNGFEIKTGHPSRSSVLKVRPASPFQSLFRRELKLFLRTPVYLMNVLPAALFPALFVLFPFFIHPDGPSLEKISGFLDVHPYFKLAVAGIAVFFNAGAIPLASTAISREGKLFALSRAIPVSAVLQVQAKAAFSLAVNVLCFLPFFIPVAFLFIRKISDVFLIGVLSVGAMIIITILNLLVDLKRPSLDWDNPQKAMQGNLNGLFSLLIAMFFLAAGAVLVFTLSFLLPWWAGCLVLLTFLLAAGTFSYKFLLNKAPELYENIEA